MIEPLHLLSIAGLSPAVVTETLWALLNRGHDVTAVTIVTTATGAKTVKETLLGPNGGIKRLCGARVPAVKVDVLLHAGRPLPDIRDPAEHAAMAAQIDRIVRQLTAEGQPALHASIAGGRKSMSAALGMSMSLHARQQDLMSHVLAAPDIEGDPTFLFPAQNTPSKTAGVFLVDIPFVRLRALLPAGIRSQSATQLISGVQARITQTAPLVLDVPARRLVQGETSTALPPVLCALLALLADRGPTGVDANGLDVQALCKFYLKAGAGPAATASLARRLARDPSDLWLREHVSRLRRMLEEAQASGMPGTLHIARTGKRPNSRYVLRGHHMVVRSTNDD